MIKAFWIFVSMLEYHMPIDYYSNMTSVMVDSIIIKELIQIYIPEFGEHLENVGVEPLLFLV